MALLADSTVWAWGSDNVGQLGNGVGVSTTNVPVQVAGITTATAISAGAEHAMVLLADSTVWSWGIGSSGQLGNGFTTTNFAPVQVLTATATPLTKVIQIDAGSYHNVILKNDNTVWTWGNNIDGQLGIGSYTQANFAQYSSGFSGGTQKDIAAGDGFTMVLNNGGSTKVVGNNDRSRLGLNAPTSTPWPNTPITGPPITNAIDIVIPPNAMHGWAITSTGQVWSWGNNDNGAVGIGATPVTVDTPTLVSSNACTAAPSVSNRPQPCCVAVLEDERTVLQGDITFTISQTYTSLDMAVFGTITLNGGSHTFTTCDVVFGKDAKIIVNSGAKLYVESSSHFYACGDMWDGIIVNNGGRVYVRTSSIIEDAEIAVDIQYGALYTLNNATFNRNFIHVRKTMPLSGSPTNTGDYRIVKCKFKCQDYHGTGGVYSNLLPPRQADTTAIAIQAIGVPKLLVGNTSANANTFSNSGWGIWAQTVPRVEVLFNTFKDMILVGTHVSDGAGLGGETIRVAKNTMLRMPYGIYCYDNPKAEIKIDSNTVNFAGMTMPPSVMTGIAVEEITPGNSSFPNKVRIFDNDVFNAPSGIRVANLFGNALTPTTYIGENTVTHTKDVTYTDGAGILMQNVTGAVVKGNNVSGAAGINWWEHGIRSDGTTNLFLCDTVHHVGNGFTFDGDNRPSTLLALNIMDQNSTGIFLNNGIIGAQGSSSMPNDNVWTTTTTWSPTNPHIMSYDIGSNGNLSPFVVQTTVPKHLPQHRAIALLGIQVPFPGNTLKTWTLGCIYSPPSFKTEGGEEHPALAEAMGMIAESTEVQELGQSLTDRQRSIHWAGQFGLYKQLFADEELRQSHDALQAYFTEKDGDNMGRLFRAMEEFQAKRTNSLDGSSAENISSISDITSDLLPEQRLVEVLGILNANISDLKALSEQDVKRLREIAQMCPLDEGFAVHIARASLLKLDTLPKYYFTDCGAVPSPEEFKTDGLQDTETAFRAYPNPSNGLMQLDYVLNEGEKGTLSLFSVVGQLLLQRQLDPSQFRLNLDMNSIGSGTYLLRVDVDEEQQLMQKINIIK